MAQTSKNLPTVQETQVQSLGWKDPLEKGMAIHSNILASKIPWTEEPGWLQSSVSDAIQPSHPLSPPSLLALNLSQHQSLF